jgi:hypothetical protein
MGMTIDEAQKAYAAQGAPANTSCGRRTSSTTAIKAYNFERVDGERGFASDARRGRYFTSRPADRLHPSPNNYGDCGVRSLVITGPMYQNVGMTIAKTVRMAGPTSAEFTSTCWSVRANLPVTGVATRRSNYQITGTNPTNGARSASCRFRCGPA